MGYTEFHPHRSRKRENRCRNTAKPEEIATANEPIFMT
jgi:hypothetical protein